jgi:hypothetical protein
MLRHLLTSYPDLKVGLSISFAIALVIRVVSQYAPGILWDWHFFTWFHIWGHHNTQALAVESWGWFLECKYRLRFHLYI